MGIKLTDEQVEELRFTLEELNDHFIGAGYYEDKVRGMADLLGIVINQDVPPSEEGASPTLTWSEVFDDAFKKLNNPDTQLRLGYSGNLKPHTATLILAPTWEEGVRLAEEHGVVDYVNWDDFARGCIEPHLEKIPPFDPNANHIDVRNIYKTRILAHCLKEHAKNKTLPSVIVTHWRSEEKTHMSRETAPEGTFHLPQMAYFAWPRVVEQDKGQIKGDFTPDQ